MQKHYLSNTLLCLGVLILFGFAVVEAAGVKTDPLLPAFSALLIGCTAVIDRIGMPELS